MKNKLTAAVALVVAVTIGYAPVAQAATPVPVTADGFTQMFADKNDMTWSGGDQMTSFKAPNGKIYWISGDTFLSNGEDPDGSYPDSGTVMVGNRMLMQKGGELVNALANGNIGVPNPATGTPENQERYWPAGTFYANGYLYVLCTRVMHDTTPGSLGFKTVGSEMAKFRIASSGLLTFLGMRNVPSTGIPGGAGPLYTQWMGDAVIKNSYLYVYGQTLAPKTEPQYVIHHTYLARVPVSQVENRTSWRFFKKTTGQWVSTVAQLSQDVSNPDALVGSQVSSVRIINGKVVMLHKPWNNWGSTLYAETADNPWGPFTTRGVLESPAGTWEGKNYQTYGPSLHTSQTLGGAETGKTLVSINWNGVDFWADTLANADLYKPRFYAITL
jgi:hypothetical protein